LFLPFLFFLADFFADCGFSSAGAGCSFLAGAASSFFSSFGAAFASACFVTFSKFSYAGPVYALISSDFFSSYSRASFLSCIYFC